MGIGLFIRRELFDHNLEFCPFHLEPGKLARHQFGQFFTGLLSLSGKFQCTVADFTVQGSKRILCFFNRPGKAFNLR